MYVDLEYDEGSFVHLFENSEKDEYCLENITDLLRVTMENEISNSGKELVHRIIDQNELKRLKSEK